MVAGSKDEIRVVVYSDTRRKPKNAVSIAAHSMILSSYWIDESQSFVPISLRRLGVMGRRGFFLNLLPWDLLMPLSTLYSCVWDLRLTSKPLISAKYLMADM